MIPCPCLGKTRALIFHPLQRNHAMRLFSSSISAFGASIIHHRQTGNLLDSDHAGDCHRAPSPCIALACHEIKLTMNAFPSSSCNQAMFCKPCRVQPGYGNPGLTRGDTHHPPPIYREASHYNCQASVPDKAPIQPLDVGLSSCHSNRTTGSITYLIRPSH